MISKRIPGALLVLALLGVFCGSALGQETKELTLTLEDSIVRALKNNLNVAAEVINPSLASASVSQARQMYTPDPPVRPEPRTAMSSSRPGPSSRPGRISTRATSASDVHRPEDPLRRHPPGLPELRLLEEQPAASKAINPSYTEPLELRPDPAPAQELRLDGQPPGDHRRPEQLRSLPQPVQVRPHRHGLFRRGGLLEPRLQHREPEDAPPGPRDRARPPGQDQARGPGRHQGADRGPQRRGHRGPPRGRHPPGRSPGQAQPGPAPDAPQSGRRSLGPRARSLVPADKPEFQPFAITLEEAFAQAMAARPDLETAKTTIETKAVNFKIAKNQRLPQLDLQLVKASPGISGQQYIYDPNNPFGHAHRDHRRQRLRRPSKMRSSSSTTTGRPASP